MFAHYPLDHHAADDGDLDLLGTQRLVIMLMKRLLQFVGRCVAPEVVRIRVTLLAKLAELPPPLGNKLVFVLPGIFCHVLTILA